LKYSQLEEEDRMKKDSRCHSFPVVRVMLGACAAVAVITVISSLSDLRRYLRIRAM
jgi:hypothetical protein